MSAVQTGDWTRDSVLLALYRFYVEAVEHELDEAGISRDDLMLLIRQLGDDNSSYRDTELLTIAKQAIRIYAIGKHGK